MFVFSPHEILISKVILNINFKDYKNIYLLGYLPSIIHHCEHWI